MKIRQIRFRNINAFYGEHPPIEFLKEPLSSTGLFVISGPTGAGKSTLLDVMTLALFNRIPRILGGISLTNIENEGLIVNRQASQEAKATAYAEVEYEVGGQAYRAKWSIAKNRNGKWNNYEMEIARLTEGNPEGELFPIKNLRDFPTKNEEIIGLTYEQFVRSIVLAQGAFDQFLKARAGERSKMLEKITGTEIYRQLSQRAHEINRDYTQLLSDKHRDIDNIKLLPDAEVETLKSSQKALEADLKGIRKQVEYYTEEEKLLTRIGEAETALKRLYDRELALENNKATFAAQAQKLELHDKVADLASPLSDLQNAETNRNREAEKQQKAQKQREQSEKDLGRLVEDVRELTRSQTLTAETLSSELDTFREEVQRLSQKFLESREAARKPFQVIKETIEKAKVPWIRALDPKAIEQTALQVKEHYQRVGVELVQFEQEHPLLNSQNIRQEIERLVDQETTLGHLFHALNEQQTRLGDGQTLNARIQTQKAILEQETPNLEVLTQEVAQLDKRKTDLEQRKIRLAQEANLDELRKALVEGEPCPLCGSLEHPYAQHYINQVGKLEVELQLATADWEKKKEALNELTKKVISAQSEYRTLVKQRDELRDVYTRKRTEINRQFETMALAPTLSITEVQSQIKLVRQQRQEFSNVQALWEQDTLLRGLSEALESFQEYQQEAQRVKAEKDALYSGDDSKVVCEQLLKRFSTIQNELSTQERLEKEAQKGLAQFEADITSITTALLPVLAERGFASPTEARAALLDAVNVQRLRKQKTDLENEANDIASKRRDEEQKRTDAQQLRRTDLRVENVVEKLKNLKNEESKGQQDIGYYKRMLEEDRDKRRKLDKLSGELQKLEEQARPWQELNRLIGSAKGDEYSKFAQSLTLSQLIGLANQRLKELTDRYVLLKPHDGQEELYVLDLYQGGSERSVSSLSGGETFTLSLALALALSDLASQNVQIDSLFIDEGFGTLDPDTLDTAIVMLEKLQQDSQKTIGIISHRHEIKERISVQIQLEKGSDGNSKIRIAETI